jgi:hypothetical protein
MGWFRRRQASATESAETHVASDFADFLITATEGRALRQAIDDARVLALRGADADPGRHAALTGIEAGRTSWARRASALRRAWVRRLGRHGR